MTSKREGLGFSLYNCLKEGDDFVVVSVSNLLYFALGWISLFMKLERKATSQREHQSGEYVGGNVTHHRCQLFQPCSALLQSKSSPAFYIVGKSRGFIPMKEQRKSSQPTNNWNYYSCCQWQVPRLIGYKSRRQSRVSVDVNQRKDIEIIFNSDTISRPQMVKELTLITLHEELKL